MATNNKQLRLYAHWLDGEWQKIAYPVAVAHRYISLQRVAEGWLKLHALFGTRIALSDVQLTDSPFLLKLFADPEFRDYLKHDRSFLTLIAYPRKYFDGTKERLGRATRGLDRAHGSGWKTSLPNITVDEIRKFSEPILSLSERPNMVKWLKDRSTGPGRVMADLPHHREMLEGMLHAISHFIRETGGKSETPSQAEPRSYTDFMMEALNSQGLQGDEYHALEQVWSEIGKWVPDESLRMKRSTLIEAMEAKQPDRNKWPPEWHRVWNTVVHAWNENVSMTVGAQRSSISELPEAIIPFRGTISDIVTPASGKLLKARFPAQAGSRGGILNSRFLEPSRMLRFDPTTLSWKEVDDAVRLTRTLRRRFQSSLMKRDNEQINAAGEELIAKLRERIVLKLPTAPPKATPLLLTAITFFLPSSVNLAIKSVKFAKDLNTHLKMKANWLGVLNTLRGYKEELVSAIINGEPK